MSDPLNTVLKGKRRTKEPCLKCFLHLERCICSELPSIETKTRLALIIHAQELKRTTNTGRLAHFVLPNSSLHIRGHLEHRSHLEVDLKLNLEPLLLYPSEKAEPLTEALAQGLNRPALLIVPDGNWRQAAKVPQREPLLKDIRHVKLMPKQLDQSRVLRKEHNPCGMATLQAIAMAYEILEGSEIGAELHRVYRLKLEATLAGRPHSPT